MEVPLDHQVRQLVIVHARSDLAIDSVNSGPAQRIPVDVLNRFSESGGIEDLALNSGEVPLQPPVYSKSRARGSA